MLSWMITQHRRSRLGLLSILRRIPVRIGVLLALLLSALAYAPALAGDRLACIGADGHVEIESGIFGNCTDRTPELHELGHGPEHHQLPPMHLSRHPDSDPCCGPCVDIDLSPSGLGASRLRGLGQDRCTPPPQAVLPSLSDAFDPSQIPAARGCPAIDSSPSRIALRI